MSSDTFEDEYISLCKRRMRLRFCSIELKSDYSICNPRAFGRIADLFAKFEKVIDEIDNFEDEFQYQGDNRESELHAILEFRTKLDSCDVMKVEIQEQFRTACILAMENERKGFEEKRAQFHNDIVDLENRVEKLDDELQNWEDNLDILREEQNMLGHDFDSLRRQNFRLLNESRGLHSQIENWKDNYDVIRSQRYESSDQDDLYEEESIHIWGNEEALEEKVQDLKDQVKILEQRLEQKDSDIKIRERVIADLNEQTLALTVDAQHPYYIYYATPRDAPRRRDGYDEPPENNTPIQPARTPANPNVSPVPRPDMPLAPRGSTLKPKVGFTIRKEHYVALPGNKRMKGPNTNSIE